MIFWTLLTWGAEELNASAPQFLSVRERERLSMLRFPKRRREWLLGRWTAKQLAAHSVPSLQGLDLTQFMVLNKPEGSPYLAFTDGLAVNAPLSISHRDEWALCAVCNRADCLLGVDLERIEPRPEAFLSDYFTHKEQEYASGLDQEEQKVWITAAWSVKEAVLKALGVGLRVDTRSVEVSFGEKSERFEPHPKTWQEVKICARGFSDRPYQACWIVRGEYILSLAASPSDNLIEIKI